MNEATTNTQSINNISVFLFGAILNIMAAVDYSSLIDYSVKAIAGGFIWLTFKVIGEIISAKIKRKNRESDGD